MPDMRTRSFLGTHPRAAMPDNNNADEDYRRNVSRWERQMAANSEAMDTIQARLHVIEGRIGVMEVLLEDIRTALRELGPEDDDEPSAEFQRQQSPIELVSIGVLGEVDEYDDQINRCAVDQPAPVRRIQPRRPEENDQ